MSLLNTTQACPNAKKASNPLGRLYEVEELFSCDARERHDGLEHDSQCVIHGIKCYPDRKQWNLNELSQTDSRVVKMLTNLNIKHALPIQRFCWPKMDQANYPMLFVAPQSSGKTHGHLLYIIARSIMALSRATTDQLMNSNGDSQENSIIIENNQKRGDPKELNIDKLDIDQENFDFNSILADNKPQEEGKPIVIDPEQFIKHPKYIIICSSQDKVNKLNTLVSSIKSAAFGHRVLESRIPMMPPNHKRLELGLSEEQFALRCNEADVIIGTPPVILTCIKEEHLKLHKCRQVIFDDLDINLQLHSSALRDFAKYYLIQRDLDERDEGESFQILMFARKWNYLVRQFVSVLFKQVTLIFASLTEAALYLNLKYELEFCEPNNTEQDKMAKVLKIAIRHRENNRNPSLEPETMMITCKEFREAQNVAQVLRSKNLQVFLLDENNMTPSLWYELKRNHNKPAQTRPIHVACDKSLEFLVDSFNDMSHLVHFSMPNEMFTFDQRFRSMYELINDKDSKHKLRTTLLIEPKLQVEQARELYDMVSRSETTLRSSKLDLRDFLNEYASNLCWRWASTGVCKLGNGTKGDKLGTFCLYKHPPLKNFPDRARVADPAQDKQRACRKLPSEGDQCKIRISHLKSPNEFYFQFDALRNIDEVNWKLLDGSGESFRHKMEFELQTYRDVPIKSIKLEAFKENRVYGIYLRGTAKVVRIVFLESLEKTRRNLEELKRAKSRGHLPHLQQLLDQEYSRQYEVSAIDYGYKFHAYLRNVFELSEELMSIEPQCHRAFLLGVAPPNNEPDWTQKSIKAFRDSLEGSNVFETTVWLRQREFGCFWFDALRVKLHLASMLSSVSEDPISDLIREKLAVPAKPPSWIRPSAQLRTLSKWRLDEITKSVRFAFLRDDKLFENLFVLHVMPDLSLKVRLADFNPQLIELEASLAQDCQNKKLTQLSYFENGTYCLARIVDNSFANPIDSINRCRILKVHSERDEDYEEGLDSGPVKYLVECLDHGDQFVISKGDLFLPTMKHVTILPFQSIDAKLAGLNSKLLDTPVQFKNKLRNILYDLTRDAQDKLVSVRATLNKDKHLYLYRPISKTTYEPLVKTFERDYEIQLTNSADKDLRSDIEIPEEQPTIETSVQALIVKMLRDIATEELRDAGLSR